jgi:hypothetical protein
MPTDVLDVEKMSAETTPVTGTAVAAVYGAEAVTEERDEWGRLKNLTRETLALVFIPDLLIPLITKFLGDDDVAIRFVCKPARMSLSSEVSRTTIHVQGVSTSQCAKNLTVKKRPYVTSVSKAEWAMKTLEMPVNDTTFVAAVEGGVLDVVKFVRSHAGTRSSWDDKVCELAAKNGHVHILQWARSYVPLCDWNVGVYAYAFR